MVFYYGSIATCAVLWCGVPGWRAGRRKSGSCVVWQDGEVQAFLGIKWCWSAALKKMTFFCQTLKVTEFQVARQPACLRQMCFIPSCYRSLINLFRLPN